MANYEDIRVKVTNAKLNKLNSAAKYKTWATLRITDTNIQYEELSHELFLAATQETKITNAFAKNISTDITPNKVQLSKIIHSGEVFGKTLGNMTGNLGKKAPLDLGIPFVKDGLSKLATKAISFILV